MIQTQIGLKEFVWNCYIEETISIVFLNKSQVSNLGTKIAYVVWCAEEKLQTVPLSSIQLDM